MKKIYAFLLWFLYDFYKKIDLGSRKYTDSGKYLLKPQRCSTPTSDKKIKPVFGRVLSQK